MASFLEELWNGIFTPGTTPSLLLATNASFASLQLLLFVLLLATYSVHFLILSFLCGALWYSINWFVVEVKKFQATQAREGADIHKEGATARVPGAIDTESETETEGAAVPGTNVPLSMATAPTSTSTGSAAGAMRPPPVPVKASTASSSGSRLAPSQGVEEVRQRNIPADSSGYVSTDSEWEKVDEKEQ